MPYTTMKEIWTPLKLVGIKFYKSYEGGLYIKVGKRKRKKFKS